METYILFCHREYNEKEKLARERFHVHERLWCKEEYWEDLDYPFDWTEGEFCQKEHTQDDTQEKIIKIIEENPRVSTSDMAKRLGIGIATVKRKIKKMPNISYGGSGYSGHWEIKQVFENNESAYYCYKAIGFEDIPPNEIEKYNVMGEEWNCLELEIKL